MEKTTKRVEVSKNRERFLTIAKELSDEKLFSILCALRGPDNDKGGTESLKHLITARIRHVMFGNEEYVDHRGTGEYNINGSFYCGAPLTKRDLGNLRIVVGNALSAGQYHFLNHLCTAVESLGDRFPVTEGVTTDKVAQTLRGYRI